MSEQSKHTDETGGLSRRHALGGAAGLGLALPLLAACGGSSDSGSGGSGTGGASDGASSGGATGGGSAKAKGTVLGPASDVEVGGGVIYADAKVVVTQPTKGEFHGFSSICTHQGCPVASVANGSISCPCHGSAFSIKDGSVRQGPATRALPAVKVKVVGGKITTA